MLCSLLNQDDTLPEEEDADVETATGLELPGYQPAQGPEEVYRGPKFPPQVVSGDRQITADLIAENIRQRDLLQNSCMEW